MGICYLMPRRWRKEENVLRGAAVKRKEFSSARLPGRESWWPGAPPVLATFHKSPTHCWTLDKVAGSDFTKVQTKMTLTQADLLFHCVSSHVFSFSSSLSLYCVGGYHGLFALKNDTNIVPILRHIQVLKYI